MTTSKKLKKPHKTLRLNLGCGSNKIRGAVNIDNEKNCKPDLIHDFVRKELPYKANSVHEVYLFHTIEHIRKPFHRFVFKEIHRVLKKGGTFFISYPEFSKCIDNWRTNKYGERKTWEATIFGRQLYPSDYHVCAMDSVELEIVLRETGFTSIRSIPEQEDYNTITFCRKGIPYMSYEEMVVRTTNEIIFK